MPRNWSRLWGWKTKAVPELLLSSRLIESGQHTGEGKGKLEQLISILEFDPSNR